MNLINFVYLAKLVYVEDRYYTHYVRIYPKICTSIKGHVNASDKSLEDVPSVVTKAFLAFLSSFLVDIMWPISQSHFHVSFLCSLK